MPSPHSNATHLTSLTPHEKTVLSDETHEDQNSRITHVTIRDHDSCFGRKPGCMQAASDHFAQTRFLACLRLWCLACQASHVAHRADQGLAVWIFQGCQISQIVWPFQLTVLVDWHGLTGVACQTTEQKTKFTALQR